MESPYPPFFIPKPKLLFLLIQSKDPRYALIRPIRYGSARSGYYTFGKDNTQKRPLKNNFEIYQKTEKPVKCSEMLSFSGLL